MNKILFLLLGTVAILTTSFYAEKSNGFIIKGTAVCFTDSTLLYLDDVTDGSFRDIDSTYIINEKFIFKGTLKVRAINVAIRTKDFSNRFYFWLENSTIYVTAEKGKFKTAIIEGSKTQNEQTKLDSILESTKNRKEQEMLFIRTNPKSIISASILNGYASTWGKDTTDMLFKVFSNQIKSTYYGKKILEYITLNKNLKIGDKYADFSEQNTNGKNIKLSDFKGKVVLLDFWGSWCGPCREGNAELVKIYNQFNKNGFEILGVAAETNKEQWLTAIKTDKLPWTNVSDLNGNKNKAALIYGIYRYPTNFLIDRNGIIIAKDLRGESLKNKLEEIFK
jgi:peroxiredoxin